MPSSSASLPPPVGGWNTRESLADMPPHHAVIMDNWFPGTEKITVRRGNSAFSTGMSGNVESLIEYIPTTGTGQLFAANAGNIYDVTSAGAVGSAVVSSMTNDRWQYVNMGTSAGQFVRLFNGADTPRLYDGSSWATTAITGTGLTAANLIWGNSHQSRLWCGEEDSLDAWYLAVNAVSGAATKFPLAGIANRGGYIMAMGTWSIDAGDGKDDVAVFLTSEGEAIVYQGTDPAAVATWSLIGVFAIGKPIGRRCMVKAGTDLILITQDGFVPLSGILTKDRSQARLVALSDQINSVVNDAVRTAGTVYGWQAVLYPRSTMLLFNVPQTTTKSHQYAFNTITGAPTRFTGINAVCWGMRDDVLYWGGMNGTVNKFDDGVDDLGSNIETDVLQAFNYFKSPQNTKIFKNAEPIFESNGDPNAAIDMNVDFQVAVPTGVATASVVGSASWGVGRWGIGLWGSASQVFRGWRGVRGSGRAGAIRIRINTNSSRPSWIATNFTFVKGGQL
jgi:hypothetical protein